MGYALAHMAGSYRVGEELMDGETDGIVNATSASTGAEGAVPSAAPQVILTTLLLTDLVDSTRLTETIGDARAAELFRRHDRISRDLLRHHRGEEIDRTDGFLLLFDRPIDAVRYALAYHESLESLSAELGVRLKSRAGLHLGEVIRFENRPDDVIRGAKPVEIDGLAKPLAARIMSLAEGGQTLLTKTAFDLARRAAVGDEALPPDTVWLDHGPYLFKGVEEPMAVCEVGREALAPLSPPADSEKVRRAIRPGDETTLGWRPAVGLHIPDRPEWKLLQKLGEGGFGEVWLIRNERTREQRASKFCFQANRLRSLKRELTLFRLIREVLGERPDIARLYEVHFDSPPYYLEMEYTPGGNLAAWADRHGGINSVPLDTRLRLVAQVAEALAAAHSIGIIHKDVKPVNVLVHEDKSGAVQARLTDFGIGGLVSSSLIAQAGVTLTGFGDDPDLSTDLASRTGTRLYMAPEVIAGRPPSIQSDIYALGIMLYQVVVGDLTRPIGQGWEASVDDPLLCEDIAACIYLAPEARLSSADQLARRLNSIKTRRRQREMELARAKRDTRRRRAVRATIVALSALTVVSSVLFAWSQWTRSRRDRAANILTGFVHDFDGAIDQAAAASAGVNHHLGTLSERFVSSPAYTERIVGARSGPWVNPEAFWRSIDGGALWRHGEWLELARIPEDHRTNLLRSLGRLAVDGNDRQKYVTFCLYGQLAGPNGRLADDCVQAARSESDPGVVSAARWAAARMGRNVSYAEATSDRIRADPVSGVTFARVPTASAFRPGSPPDEEGRFDDNEDRPRDAVRIEPLWIGVNEVTLSQFRHFDPALVQRQIERMERASEAVPVDPSQTAVERVSPRRAMQFCEWLTKQTAPAGTPRLYRLPTESEWEYACRAGNTGAYCFGDQPAYLGYFTANGSSTVVAAAMPNAFGLFDMHGNVWEICSSPYRKSYDDPAPADAQAAVVMRGGALYSKPEACRCALRNFVPLDAEATYVGFRVVMEEKPVP